VVLAAGGGGPVLAAGPGAAPGAGALYVVSATGVAYRVVDDETARVLGVTGARPAPEEALQWLPDGPDLDLAEARAVVDVLLPAG
jgi:hypothetical protein